MKNITAKIILCILAGILLSLIFGTWAVTPTAKGISPAALQDGAK